VSSFHERFFRKNRFGHFYPRGPKARRYALAGLVGFLVLGGLGLILLTSGQWLAGQIVLGALVVFILIYNGFVSTRSDL
jgi:hypothetical protein